MAANRYLLLHKDVKIALFEVQDNDDIVQMRLSEKHASHLPMGCLDIATTKRWLKRRSIPISRDNISRDLTDVNLFKYMLDNLGLSLTDHYWVKPIESDYTWEFINAYSTDFKSTYSLDLKDDEELSIVGETNFVPSASLKGDLKKKWVIDTKGRRILVKGNNSAGCMQSISEVFASLIHNMQGFHHYVPYRIVEIESNGEKIKGCACENFTDLTYEFVPAIDIVNSQKKMNHLSYFEHYINVCSSNGADPLEIRNFLEYQIMTDFIVTNTDRHFNNFGVLRNSNTLGFKGPAPIFDTGNSLFYRSSYVPVSEKLLDVEVTSFLHKEVNLLKYVQNPGLVSIEQLPSPDKLYKLLTLDKTLTEEKRERIARAYRQKIGFFMDFQNGKKIWKQG